MQVSTGSLGPAQSIMMYAILTVQLAIAIVSLSSCSAVGGRERGEGLTPAASAGLWLLLHKRHLPEKRSIFSPISLLKLQRLKCGKNE